MGHKAAFQLARFCTRSFVGAGLGVAAIETFKGVGGAVPELGPFIGVLHVLAGLLWGISAVGFFVVAIQEFHGGNDETCKCK